MTSFAAAKLWKYGCRQWQGGPLTALGLAATFEGVAFDGDDQQTMQKAATFLREWADALEEYGGKPRLAIASSIPNLSRVGPNGKR